MPTITIGKVGEIPVGSMKEAQYEGQHILIANVEGKFYAINGICSHMNMLLQRGKLEGYILTCPFHGAKFDVRDGSVVAPHNSQIDQYLASMNLPTLPTRPLKKYDVKVEGESIIISS